MNPEADVAADRLIEAVKAVNKVLSDVRQAGIPLDLYLMTSSKGDWRDGQWLVAMLPYERLRDAGHVRPHFTDDHFNALLRDGLTNHTDAVNDGSGRAE